MGQTANLNLRTFNGSDVVDYNQINDNYTIIDRLGKDYVTDSGTSGRWWYRKWKSGRGECGIDNILLQNNQNATFSWDWGGGLVRSQDFSVDNSYPLSFSSKPYVNVVLSYLTTAEPGIVLQYGISGNERRPPSFFLVRPNKNQLNSCQWSIYCCGWL